ncbi:MAG: hypothetical protein P8X74_11400 [Reinekea sp.]|jgi:cell division protein FtsB
MAKVKGSAVTNLVVVPHKPIKKVFIRLILSAMVAGFVYSAYWYGGQKSMEAEKVIVRERDELRTELDQSKRREEALSQKVAVLENGSFVDKRSVNSVRQSNRELSDKIAQLEKDIALYQGIMSPSVNSTGLTIQEVTLTSTPSDRRYRFKVMLTQVGNNNNYLRGFVGINLIGVENGEVTAYPLKALSSDISDVDIKFRYRYFQDFKGELILPEGFTPDQVQVVAQSVGNKSSRIEKAFNWSDLENGNNVGQ